VRKSLPLGSAIPAIVSVLSTGRDTTLPFEAKRICSGGRFSSFDSRLDRENAS